MQLLDVRGRQEGVGDRSGGFLRGGRLRWCGGSVGGDFGETLLQRRFRF